MKVIGAGFGRTGTTSLKAALERLGFGPCYHMTEVFAHPEHAEIWSAAGRGEPVDWEGVLGGYEATLDWPACAFYGDGRHNEEVKRRVPPERLLVYEVKEGWGPLCEFLGAPEPEEPFPRLDDAAQMRLGMKGVRALATALPVALTLSVAATIVLLLRRARW